MPKVTDELSGPNTDLRPEFKFLTKTPSVFTVLLSASLCHLNRWQNDLLKGAKNSSRSWIMVKTIQVLDLFLFRKLTFL